ncbi:MAG: AMP-binding protein [Candidatus Lambdaproteobacteria bacterium]|nr:AMP-binding protein [Candidatus Lambdaproteobacteria bacterium]
MIFDPILPQSRIDAMRRSGQWPDRIITDYLDDAVAERPDRIAVTDVNSLTGRSTSLSYRQLDIVSRRMALGMTALGVEPGDVVSFQLPNWWHVAALYMACTRIGAAINPLMPIFRDRELSFMLGYAETKLLVIPRRFRGFDYPQMLRNIRKDVPKLRHVLVVDGEQPESAFEAVLLNRRWEDELDGAAIFRERRPDPNAISELIYTSGTTGQPKGVMHTHNTIVCNNETVIEHVGITADDVILMASPLAHNTGFLYGMVTPIVLHAKSVLQDVWDPILAAQRIQDEGVTLSMASTPFLADLTYNEGVNRYATGTLRTFIVGGAPIPRVLVKAATEKFKMRVISAWGMSENGIVTATRQGDPDEKVYNTDGVAIRDMEVRVVDADGKALPPGREGRLQARGKDNFVGYLKKPAQYDMDRDGWFETGDNASMDQDGYIRITGRSKDILIRGAENIPVVEVEQLLYRHPDVQDCAIVGMPDERLGERGCCFIVLKPGAAMTFRQMQEYLAAEKVAKNYWPERLEIVAELPRTPSGKIQKFKLREAAKSFTAA